LKQIAIVLSRTSSAVRFVEASDSQNILHFMRSLIPVIIGVVIVVVIVVVAVTATDVVVVVVAIASSTDVVVASSCVVSSEYSQYSTQACIASVSFSL
jgi:hypothetical protein